MEGSQVGALLAVSIIVAVLVAWSAWRQRGAGIKSSDPMPGASFDFQQSWLSTFAGLLAVLGSMNLSSMLFTNDVTFPILSLFFAALVALGPLVYKALGETVGAFMAAAMATLWAAFGVLISLGLALYQVIQLSETQPQLAALMIMGLIVFILPLIASYAHGKIVSLLRSQRSLSSGVYFL